MKTQQETGPIWLTAATDAEIAAVSDLDSLIVRLDAERRRLTHERGMITHRACQRALARSRAQK